MKIPLKKIRTIVEGLTMRDECLITRDPELTTDDEWDEDTGSYAPPDGDHDEIYAGPASFYPFSAITQDGERGGEDIAETRYWVAIPVESNVICQPEDQITCTAVDEEDGDPTLVDQVFVVDSQEFVTLASSRRFRCRRLEARP